MVDIASIWLTDAKLTHKSGKSLANTLYSKSLTIGLVGDLGAGKTTLTNKLVQRLGIELVSLDQY